MSAPASVDAPRLDLTRRDLTLDLARVCCVLLVVVIHLLQVGIGTDAEGDLVASRPLEQQPWFAVATWFGQIMPLFFVVGGFAAATGWRSWTAKGGDATGFVRQRSLRLAQPALPLFVFFAVVLGAAALLGLPAGLVGDAATGAGSPLWFLAAYLLCQAAVPVMMRLHATAPQRTLVVLVAAGVVVDVARYTTGVEWLGLANLAFVWLAIQQLGFFYADGWFARRHPLTVVGIVAACYAVLVPLLAVGPYSPNMLDDLNPPTMPLVILGVAQAGLLRLAHRPLAALMRRRGMQAFVFLAGSRLMTIYLWHLPVILALTGIALLIPGASPEPASPAWWWSRIPFLLAVLVVVWLVSLGVTRWEAVRGLGPVPATGVVALGTALAFVPPFVVMQWHLNLTFAIGGAVLLALAVALLRDRRSA